MISIDEQLLPDPSSSVNQNLEQQQQEQEKLSHEAFASVSDIDLLQHSTVHANFSIRDYVFESRCKDIAHNWPFSSKSLQLCLNYGLKNLLPPFQSLDSVRNCDSDSRIIEDDLDNKKSNSQSEVMKCKFVMKMAMGDEPVEESAGSKVCPVCKTFSSSSNTTLNAHIDRCLSEESGIEPTVDVKLKKLKVKHKIKPRKMRLMVDVYKTASRCTIEELDRRNGTNWATNSCFLDQELEFQAEEKKKEPREPSFVPSVADHDGAVYIDENGKKVRILSMTKSSNLDDDDDRDDDDDKDDEDEACILQKGRKCGKALIKKKNKKASEVKNGKKILKVSPNSKKLTKKVSTGQKENLVIKESGAKPLKAQVNKQMDDLVITRPPWACSKRSGVAKKRPPVHADHEEGTGLDGSGENRVRLKGSVLSSFDKSLSANREHIAGSKLVKLKRKFSAPQRSQDSLKLKFRTEDDTRKEVSSETVKRKKSITSEGSNENMMSARIEDGNGDGDGKGFGRNLMRLTNPLDNEFPEMVSELDDRFDSTDPTLDDIIMDHNGEKRGSYLDKVDPIPIPGPPGSFLPPSPGADMGSEELQGNSSLTTMSRVQSSEEYHFHHDIMNQDLVSGSSISTVSSPSFARTARFDAKSVNNTSEFRSGDAVPTENGSIPCCCSRKEGAFFKNLASYNQESAVSKERVTESNALRPQLFPLINHLTLPPPESVKSPAVVSPTTPVLRLMGKNLTVVNTNDEPVKPPRSSPMPQHQQYQQLQKFQHESRDSLLYGYPLQNHITFNHNQNGSTTGSTNGSTNQLFNLYPPNNPKSHADLRSATANTNNGTKEVIVIDDLDENEREDHHMFKEPEPMTRSHGAYGFTNPYANRSLQASSSLRDVANDGDRSRWASTAYYPRSFS